MKDDVIEIVRNTIREHGLLSKGDHIVLGLSGGPDSVCLFHLLQRLSAEYALTIHPVHINHGFRPGDADADQAYVEELCAKAGLTCRSFVVDCSAMAKELGMTSEEAGRKARYDAFYQVASEVAASPADPGPALVRIAVAQNANDQAETILHRILRGTGTDGLAGIAYLRYEKDIPVIRPLLDVPRNLIEGYCSENHLHPVTDHTNNEPVYTRNRIRLELLPQLEKYNENIISCLARLGRIAADDKEYLWLQAEAAFRALQQPGTASEIILDRAGLASLPPAIRHRVISRAFSQIGLTSDVSEERLRAADAIILKKQAPKTVEFPRGYSLTVAKGLVHFRTTL